MPQDYPDAACEVLSLRGRFRLYVGHCCARPGEVWSANAMRITAIPQIYRNVARWREILAILSKYGLADWISRLGPEFAKDLLKDREGMAIARHTWPTRIRLALGELGPTFVKLGQVLSTRPDLVGSELATELQQLQDNVAADPPDTVRAIVERALGRPLEECFTDFEPRPIASASIGQVHRARLKGGQHVAVKVQHPDVPRKFQADLEILVGLANWAEKIPELAMHRPRAIATELQRSLRRELDFSRELRNMQEFARNFAGDPTVRIPHPFPEFSGPRVLTMGMLEGIKLVVKADVQGSAEAVTQALEKAATKKVGAPGPAMPTTASWGSSAATASTLRTASAGESRSETTPGRLSFAQSNFRLQ